MANQIGVRIRCIVIHPNLMMVATSYNISLETMGDMDMGTTIFKVLTGCRIEFNLAKIIMPPSEIDIGIPYKFYYLLQGFPQPKIVEEKRKPS